MVSEPSQMTIDNYGRIIGLEMQILELRRQLALIECILKANGIVLK